MSCIESDQPPRLARLMARVFLTRFDADRLLGALDQEYHESQRPALGRAAANSWYRKQVWRSLGPLRAGARGRNRKRHGPVGAERTGGGGADGWWRDAAYGLRKLIRNPSYSIIAVLTLALGIGANASLFSVVRSVLLLPLPYDSPERIYRAWAHADNGSITDFSFRVSELKALAGRTGGVFERVGAEFPIDQTVLIPGQDPLQLSARMISAGFFDVFGVEPVRGRMFTSTEIEGGQSLVTVTSYGFAERYLGGIDGAVGQSLLLGGGTFTVVGVLPRDYDHISGDADLFIPYTIGTSGWIAHWLDLYARVGPSVSAEQARDDINAVMHAVGEIEGRSRGWHATVEPLHEMVVGDVRVAVWAVFGTAVFVLLIACVNVAILTLARAVTRRREMRVRIALGAGRGRLVRQLLMEHVTLALIGGVVGTFVAWAGVKVLLASAPTSLPRIQNVSLDVSVVAFALIVTVATGLVFGLFPALGASGAGATGLVGGRGTTAGRRTSGVLNGLVTAQVALSVMLLVGAVLLVEGFRTLRNEDMGFDRGGSLVFRTVVPSARYPRGTDTYAFYDRLRSELLRLPGVTAAGAGANLPVSGDGAVAGVTSDARVLAGIDESVTVLQGRASQGFFQAMGTRIVDGRGFDSRDRSDSPPVLIISESLADLLFPGESAVGKRIGWGGTPGDDDWLTVVGVVSDVRYRGPDVDQYPQVYQAHGQSPTREMAVVLRTTVDPTTLIEPARALLRRLDAQVPMYSITTLQNLVNVAVAGRRFTMTLFGVFAMIALTLTASGLFGVLTFVIQQRRREIGVRIALGAGTSRVTGLVIGRALRMIAAGLILGIPGAVVVFGVLDSLLYRVSPMDFSAYVAGTALIVLVAIVAGFLPARTATKTDPVTVLKEQ